MDTAKKMKRVMVRESIESHCMHDIDERINRYLEIEHQGIIGGHYFAPASSECIYLYRDGYFIGAVMMSHAINEGIIKFVSERNGIQKNKPDSMAKTIKELVCELNKENLISNSCKDASLNIWKSYRNDIHHMNSTVANINFKTLAQRNLKHLSTIEKEIFGHKVKNGAIEPTQPKYWDINADGTAPVFLRLE